MSYEPKLPSTYESYDHIYVPKRLLSKGYPSQALSRKGPSDPGKDGNGSFLSGSGLAQPYKVGAKHRLMQP